ncbi:MAG: hypothetical protein IJ237_01325 [Oscillospiraceae bacterium]|nr:hypothetical protein [Oscillospiraceae bacterium]
MYEQSAKWNLYYQELNPGERKRLYEELKASEPDDGANAFRERIFAARHTDPARPGHEVDTFLFQCVSLIQTYHIANFFRRNAIGEVEKAFQIMLYDEASQYGEAGEKALYWELRNAAARYFKTCETSGYNRSLFGLIQSGSEGRLDRMCRDAWQITRGLAQRTGSEERMRIWNQAVLDAYLQADANGAERLKKYEEKSSKKAK